MPKPYRHAPLVDTLTAPPVIGQVYAVRCVWHKPREGAAPVLLPVIGRAHRDPEIGPFAGARHLHFDFRFITRRELRDVFGVTTKKPLWERALGRIHWCAESGEEAVKSLSWSNLHVVRTEGWEKLGAPAQEVIARKMQSGKTHLLLRRCIRSMPVFPDQRSPCLPKALLPITYTVEEICRGRRIDPTNPVCPHKGISLASVPVIDGCIDCPGHGLRFDAKTGEIVSRYADLDEATHIDLMHRLHEQQKAEQTSRGNASKDKSHGE